MKILGISAFYHDSAAALVIDGRLVAAASEERFSRIKHDPEMPVDVVRFCLDRANISVNDLDCIVFYDKPLTKFDRILTGYMATPIRSYRAFITALPVWLRRKLWVEHVIHKETGYEGEVLYLPHHLSHAAGTFFESPFDKAAILTVDGVGEWATASIGIGDNNHVHLLKQMHYPHSVGLLYSAFTYYLGFMVNSAEYKVMGLAPYGEPVYADLIKDKLVKVHDDGSIYLNMKYFAFHHSLTMTGRRFSRLFARSRRLPEETIEPFHENVAASIQQVTEEIIIKMATHAQEVTRLERLCLSGGVALNCRANGLLLKQGIFEDIYAQPASGDAGGAVGAALYAYHRLTGDNKHFQPFFDIGPTYSDEEIRRFLDQHDIPYKSGAPEELAAGLAGEIAGGRIVALFDGAMEFGPRALGFRSIVADPRDNRMKERINAAVKYREAFRPFAPAVLKERVSEYFDCDGTSPYMLFNYTVREDKRSVIPAVTHVDNSSRIQTVARYDNPVLYKLIEAFDAVTGVPVVLNTSFNLRGHPIVNTPEEAFTTFCSGGIDFLLIGSFLIDKSRLDENLVRAFAVEKKPD